MNSFRVEVDTAYVQLLMCLQTAKDGSRRIAELEVDIFPFCAIHIANQNCCDRVLSVSRRLHDRESALEMAESKGDSL